MRYVRSIGCLAIVACTFSGACGRQSGAEAPPRDERKFTPVAEASAETRTQAIADEMRNLQDHAWAGEYFHGDGLGVNVSLLLAPESGFVFIWRGCLGVYDRNYGPVTQDGDDVTLHCEFANHRQGFRGIATSLRPIRWGERRYLIPDDQMIEFCNAVNSGVERDGASGRFLIRIRDGERVRPVVGNPELPEPYARLLLEDEIRGTVTEIRETTTRSGRSGIKFINTDVTLDIGTAQGVFEGMELYVHETESIQTVRVTKAGERTSVAHVQRIDSPRPRAKVGWKVSSRFHRAE